MAKPFHCLQLTKTIKLGSSPLVALFGAFHLTDFFIPPPPEGGSSGDDETAVLESDLLVILLR